MNILVIAAHPDDEALGCGGTIARYSKDHSVSCLILGDGVTSRIGFGSDKDIEERKEMAESSAKVLGISDIELRRFQDNRFDMMPFISIVRDIEFKLKKFNPDIIFTHSVTDLNIDHVITAKAVLTATRPMGGKLKGIFSCEIPSSTEWSFGQNGAFKPNLFFDITSTLETKMLALKEYGKEMRAFPHPRSEESIRALAMYRGSAIGVPAAESFETIWYKVSM